LHSISSNSLIKILDSFIDIDEQILLHKLHSFLIEDQIN